MNEADTEFEKKQLLQKIFGLFVERRDLGLKLFMLEPKTVKTPVDYRDIKKAQARMKETHRLINLFGKQYFRIAVIVSDKTPFVYLDEVFGPILVRALLVRARMAAQLRIPKKPGKGKESEDFAVLSEAELRKLSEALRISIELPRKAVAKNREIGFKPRFSLKGTKHEL